MVAAERCRTADDDVRLGARRRNWKQLATKRLWRRAVMSWWIQPSDWWPVNWRARWNTALERVDQLERRIGDLEAESQQRPTD